jgi:hypothetical protein
MRIIKALVIIFWLAFATFAYASGSDKGLANSTPNATPSICVPADGSTICVVISNIGSNLLCVGDSSTGSGQCEMAIPANQSGTICNSDNQWCYSASGTTASYLKLRK